MSEPLIENAPAEPAGNSVPDAVQWEPDAAPTPEPVEAPAPDPTPAEPTAPADFTAAQLENGEHEIRLATGQVYKGKSQEEAWAQVARGQVEASRTIQEMRKAATPPASPQQQSAPAPQELDPTALALADYTAQGMGFRNAAEMKEAFEEVRKSTQGFQSLQQEAELNHLAKEFVTKTPDFVVTERNTAIVEQALEEHGLQPSLKNLQLVHNALKGQGLYEAAPIPPPPAPRSANGQFQPRTAMPLPPNSAAPASTGAAPVDVWALSDADFQKEFASRIQY